AYLGPTFEPSRGDAINPTQYNNLGNHPLAGSIDTALHGALASDSTAPRTSVHFHGGNTEEDSDGYPTHTFQPGNSRLYHYNNDQEAATLWYHDHALGITRLNVYSGLAGMYLLRDAEDTGTGSNPLGLPFGDREIPLVIQDKAFNADGSLFYTAAPWAPEFFGDAAVVNGKAWPFLDVAQGAYRFRMLNGSNSRFYRLTLSDKKLPMHQIGTDGGLMNNPATINELILAPGERADVIIDFSGYRAGEEIILQNDAPAPFPSGRPRRRAGGFPLPEIMKFRVTGATAPGWTPPQGGLRITKPAINPAPLANAVARDRFLTLVEILGPQGPLVALLNYVYFDEAENDPGLEERPTVDTVERWNLINLTGDTHPIHLHLIRFLVENRQRLNTTKYMQDYTANTRQVQIANAVGGSTVPQYPPLDPAPYLTGPAAPPRPNEVGWKDIVQANPGEVTRILVPFGAGAAGGGVTPFGNSFKGRFVWHCHILEHEDNEMMLPYTVV
ncbi:MAG TPA: multicopper oxidase domain-containing protein, partial [Gammaproteobacteria bacterium]|nr:multicopper oxidase domain-containing protein [Gammaproteobacteria bacterium]